STRLIGRPPRLKCDYPNLLFQHFAGRGVEMNDARIQRAVHLETAVREYLQHLAVVAEHVGFELRDPVCLSDETQMFEQQRADAAALELVENCERDLCAMRIGAANVTTDADEALAPILGYGRGQAGVILEVELGQTLEIVRRQIALGPHETK